LMKCIPRSLKMTDAKGIYSDERQKEILNNFQVLLQSADNMGVRDGQSVSNPGQVDYKKFWVALRGDGAALFGLTNYLKQVLDYQIETAGWSVQEEIAQDTAGDLESEVELESQELAAAEEADKRQRLEEWG